MFCFPDSLTFESEVPDLWHMVPDKACVWPGPSPWPPRSPSAVGHCSPPGTVSGHFTLPVRKRVSSVERQRPRWWWGHDFKISSFQSWQVWLSWLERWPVNWKVVGLIWSQGTHLDCGFGPCSGVRAQTRGSRSMLLSHIDVSLPLCLLLPLSEINKHVLGWGLK